ncbi:hypothetical protein NDU88_001833 [Pleurodeles waltl]|uniref:Uncharacterized protein n=1 Tax=Pleurodeles waltl TaxID=8319 RepID=A0AAV7WJJ3_PLEWA|nr:hypothetical protein NDU88_001833 [Pleurodeles waltl]
MAAPALASTKGPSGAPVSAKHRHRGLPYIERQSPTKWLTRGPVATEPVHQGLTALQRPCINKPARRDLASALQLHLGSEPRELHRGLAPPEHPRQCFAPSPRLH